MAGVGDRNAQWKTDIDQRVASGGQLGLSYLQGLSTQYNVPYDQITGFISKNGYTLGAKAQAAVTGGSTGQTNEPFSPGDYPKFSLEEVQGLTEYLNFQLNPGSILSSNPLSIMGGDEKYADSLAMLADYMGIQKISSEAEINKALTILAGANDPLAKSLSTTQGIQTYDSVNDYLKVLGGGVGAPIKNTSSSSGSGYGAGSGSGAGALTAGTPTGGGDLGLPPEPPKPEYQSARNADLSGNASGWRSRKSSWRTKGLATKGTSNLKIGPISNAAGVGLNSGTGSSSGLFR